MVDVYAACGAESLTSRQNQPNPEKKTLEKLSYTRYKKPHTAQKTAILTPPPQKQKKKKRKIQLSRSPTEKGEEEESKRAPMYINLLVPLPQLQPKTTEKAHPRCKKGFVHERQRAPIRSLSAHHSSPHCCCMHHHHHHNHHNHHPPLLIAPPVVVQLSCVAGSCGRQKKLLVK
jgi:hypothetical protein